MIVWEQGAENCLLRESPLNDIVPGSATEWTNEQMDEQTNYMNKSSCRTDRRELNHNNEWWNPPLIDDDVTTPYVRITNKIYTWNTRRHQNTLSTKYVVTLRIF